MFVLWKCGRVLVAVYYGGMSLLMENLWPKWRNASTGKYMRWVLGILEGYGAPTTTVHVVGLYFTGYVGIHVHITKSLWIIWGRCSPVDLLLRKYISFNDSQMAGLHVCILMCACIMYVHVCMYLRMCAHTYVCMIPVFQEGHRSLPLLSHLCTHCVPIGAASMQL